MTKRTIVVTGANRGLGLAAALALAAQGHRLVLACRDAAAGTAAAAGIRRSSGNDDVAVLPLDLGSAASIDAFALAFLDRYGALDTLVHNAGTASRKGGRTADGHELVVGTNYFGPFRLTRALLPAFSRGDARIVGLSSSIYPLGRFKSAKLDSYRWVKAYAVSKYAMLLFMLALAERLAPLGISANAVDPGVVRTSIMFSGLWTDTLVDLLCRPFYVSPEEGAAEVVRLAAAPEARGLTGGFWRRGRAVALPAGYADPALVRESFAATERLLGSFYPVP